MLINRIADGTSKEHVDLVVVNASGATITVGNAAAFTTTAASVDGIQVVSPAVNNNRTFAGIAIKSIPNVGVGLVRAYGFVQSVFLFATGSSTTVTVQDPLGPGVAGSLGIGSTTLREQLGPVIALETVSNTNSAGTYIKGFVRAL